jgi:hypothetical protein
MDAETELPSPREPPTRLRPVSVAAEAWKALAEHRDMLATLAALGFVPVLLSILWDSLLLELLGLAGLAARLASWAVLGLGWATGAYVASHWHRLLLLGREDVRATLPRWTQAETRLFWWYVGLAVLGWVGGFLLFLPLILVDLLAVTFPWLVPPGSTSPYVLWTLALGLAAASVYVPLRVSLAFPAAVVKGPAQGFTDSWRAVAGNGWRLAAATALALLPLAPALFLGAHLMTLGDVRELIGAVLLTASEILLLVVLAGVLSLAYRQLVLLGGPVPLLPQDEEDRPDPAAEAGVRSLAPRARLLEEPDEEDETPAGARF